MTLNSSKSARSGLSAQKMLTPLLQQWRLHPLSIDFLQQMNFPSPLEQLSVIRPIVVPHDHKIDAAFDLYFNPPHPNLALYLSHKNVLLPPIDLPKAAPDAFLSVLSHLLSHWVCITHATHHLARIHFQHAHSYQLFDPNNPKVGALLLAHFVDGEALGFNSPLNQSYVLEHLKQHKRTILQHTFAGLQPPYPNYLSISLSLDPAFPPLSSNTIASTPHLNLGKLRKGLIALGRQTLSSSDTPDFDLQTLLDACADLFSPLYPADWIRAAWAHSRKHLESFWTHPLMYWQHMFAPCTQKNHEQASERFIFIAFLHTLFLTASIYLRSPPSVQAQEDDSHPLTVCALNAIALNQVYRHLEPLPMHISTPKEHQIGVIGNAHWHLQRGKSLSAGTQTDVQVKTNPCALMLADFIEHCLPVREQS